MADIAAIIYDFALFYRFFAFFLQKVLENKKIAVYLHRQKETTYDEVLKMVDSSKG